MRTSATHGERDGRFDACDSAANSGEIACSGGLTPVHVWLCGCGGRTPSCMEGRVWRRGPPARTGYYTSFGKELRGCEPAPAQRDRPRWCHNMPLVGMGCMLYIAWSAAFICCGSTAPPLMHARKSDLAAKFNPQLTTGYTLLVHGFEGYSPHVPTGYISLESL